MYLEETYQNFEFLQMQILSNVFLLFFVCVCVGGGGGGGKGGAFRVKGSS